MTKKEDILAQLLEDILQGIMDQVQHDILPGMPADQQLTHLVKAHIACLCRYPEGKAFILYESHLLSERAPEILNMRDQYQQLLEAILVQERGSVSLSSILCKIAKIHCGNLSANTTEK